MRLVVSKMSQVTTVRETRDDYLNWENDSTQVSTVVYTSANWPTCWSFRAGLQLSWPLEKRYNWWNYDSGSQSLPIILNMVIHIITSTCTEWAILIRVRVREWKFYDLKKGDRSLNNLRGVSYTPSMWVKNIMVIACSIHLH